MRGSVVLIYLLASLLPWDMVVINKHLITDQFPEKKAKVLEEELSYLHVHSGQTPPEPAFGEWRDRELTGHGRPLHLILVCAPPAPLARLSRQVSLRLGGSLTGGPAY